MKSFDQYLNESGQLEDVYKILFDYGFVNVSFDDETGIITTVLDGTDQISELEDILPSSLDYEFVVADVDDEDQDSDLDVDDIDGDEEVILVIYTDNAELEMDEDDTKVMEARRQIKVDARGKRRIRIKCNPGYRYVAASKACVRITDKEKRVRRLAIKKAVKTRRRAGASAKRKSTKLRLKALKKRKSMGVKDGS